MLHRDSIPPTVETGDTFRKAASVCRSTRSRTIDGLKAIASNLIVWHHLASYGPAARAAQQAAPMLIDWLYDYGRMAVQVFLVIAGYLSARTFAAQGRAVIPRSIALLIAQRYLRLVLPFAVSIVLALLCADLARPWIDDDIVPAPATLGQFVAHLLLVQNLLGFESLTAGAWYVSIDLQLFALTLLLLRGLSVFKHEAATVLGVAACTLVSWLWLRGFEALENWAPYFFGAYGLGMLACWARSESRSARAWSRICIALLALVLLHAFQWRLLIALETAALLVIAGLPHVASRAAAGGYGIVRSVISFFGKTSYALFLVHFPLALLGNALFDRLQPDTDFAGLSAMLIIWAASVATAMLFQRYVESPAARLRGAVPFRNALLALRARAESLP